MLDFIHVRTYDYHGSWDSKVGHPSPLYPSANETGDDALQNMYSSIQYWLSLGTPKEKLVASIALYGRSFTLLDSADFEVGAPDNGSGPAAPFTREPGFIAYYEICELLNNGAVRYWHDEHKVPYLINGTTWVGYDDAESIAIKVRWLKDMDIGGVMIWAMDLDDYTGQFCGKEILPLLTTVNLKMVERRLGIKNEPVGVNTKRVNSTIKAFIEKMLESRASVNDIQGLATWNTTDGIPASVLKLADTVTDIKTAMKRNYVPIDNQITANATGKGFPLDISNDISNDKSPLNAQLEGAKDNEQLFSYLQTIIKGSPYINSTHISNEDFLQFLEKYSGLKMSSTAKENSTEIIKTSPKRAKLRVVETVKSGVFSPVLSRASTVGRLDMQPKISFSIGNRFSLQTVPSTSAQFEFGNKKSSIKTADGTQSDITQTNKSLTENVFPTNTHPNETTITHNSLENRNIQSVNSNQKRLNRIGVLPDDQTPNTFLPRHSTQDRVGDVVSIQLPSNRESEQTEPSYFQLNSNDSSSITITDAIQQQYANNTIIDKVLNNTEPQPSLSDNVQLNNEFKSNMTNQVAEANVVNQTLDIISKLDKTTTHDLQSAKFLPLADSRFDSSTKSSDGISKHDSVSNKVDHIRNTLQLRATAARKSNIVKIQDDTLEPSNSFPLILQLNQESFASNQTNYSSQQRNTSVSDTDKHPHVKEHSSPSDITPLSKGINLPNINKMSGTNGANQNNNILSGQNKIAKDNLNLERTADSIDGGGKTNVKQKTKPDPMDDMFLDILAIPLLPSDSSPLPTSSETKIVLNETHIPQDTIYIMPIIKQLEKNLDVSNKSNSPSLIPEANPTINEYNYRNLGITNEQIISNQNKSGDNASNASKLSSHSMDHTSPNSNFQMTNDLSVAQPTRDTEQHITSPQTNTQTASEIMSKQGKQVDLNQKKAATVNRTNEMDINNFNDIESRMFEFEPSSTFHNGMKLKSKSVVDSSKNVSPRTVTLQLLQNADSGIFPSLLSDKNGKLSTASSNTGMGVSDRLSADKNPGVSYEITNRADPIQKQHLSKSANGLDKVLPQLSNIQQSNQAQNLENMQKFQSIGVDTKQTPVQESEPWHITLLKYNQGLRLKSTSMTSNDSVIKTSPKRARLRHVEAVRRAVFSPMMFTNKSPGPITLGTT